MTTRPRAGFLWSSCAIAFGAYVPYVWLILAERPWSDDRLSWIRLWPILPGLLPRAFFFTDASDLVGTCVMAAATVVLLAPFVFWGERSSRSLWSALIVVLLLSCLNSWCAYHAFRA